MRRILQALLCVVLFGTGTLAVAEEREQETRKTPALTERAYKKLAEAQELIDAKDYAGALEVLREMGEQRGMNAYELASKDNMRAFVAFSMEDYGLAIEAYEGVLSFRPEIPLALEQSALYALGQLNFVEEDYARALRYLDEWFQVAENPNPQAYIFKAQALYQLQRYADIPPVVYEAMDEARERDMEINENWWLLIRAAYYELEDWPKVLEILEVLVAEFPKKDYWVQLSGIYGQEGMGKKQVAAIWAAYIQGFLDQEREIMNVAGLLLQEEVPYYAATILERELDKGVVEDTAKNLQMLGQAWQLAQEADKAIPVYRRAAAKSDEGELYFRLAQLYLDKDQCEQSVEASQNALDKGGLKNEAQVLLVKGMCQFELKEYAAAIETFSRGQRIARRDGFDTDLRALNNWKRYVENESARAQELARSAG
jgi:tetratricopeptide (TPR) repeat protein